VRWETIASTDCLLHR